MEFSKFFLLALVVRVSAIGTCYNPGPAFPTVEHVLTKRHFDELSIKLDDLIKTILNGPESWTTNTTSFAVQLTSSQETLWSHYYTAPILGEYKDSEPSPVTGDTNFRVASISKTFTVYALLLEHSISLEDPITKYIPELLDGDKPEDRLGILVHWKQISIRSLASQLSGISRETGLEDLAVTKSLLEDPIGNGFPPTFEGWEAPCWKNSTDSCNATTIVKSARTRFEVFAANDRSTYSNVAFSLLGMVIERATGKSYAEIITKSILKPLEMENTRTSKPADSTGIIPFGPNGWAQPLGADIPSGGIYSTANDLSKYLRSILTPKLLSNATINAWMKPHSWTSSTTNSAYGMPWEILRTTKGTPDSRPIDVITKGGSLTGYFSTIALLPEFGLGVTILVAGDSAALYDLRENILATLIPAVDELLRREIQRTYCGLWAFRDDWFGPPNLKWSFRLEVDEKGPGLRLANWLSNGTDFLSVYGKLKGMPSSPDQWSARLLPTGIYGDTPELQVELWRLTAVPKRNPDDESKIFNDYCMTNADALMYAGSSVEEFYIGKASNEGEGDGEAWLLWTSVWNMIPMMKWSDCEGRIVSLGPEKMRSTKERFGHGVAAQKPLFG